MALGSLIRLEFGFQVTVEGVGGGGTKRTYRNTLRAVQIINLQETLLTFELGGLLPKGQHTGPTKHRIAV